MTSQLLSKEYKKSLESAAQRYEANLSQATIAYLKGRGITEEVARDQRYRLGTVTRDDLLHPEYAGWLAIPYITRAGVVSFKFRNPEPNAKPKYIGPYEHRLYNTQALDDADERGMLAITEGEIDAITLHALCDIPAVAIPGVDAYQGHPEWAELFRYPMVLVFQDQDEPGEKLAKAIRADTGARIVRLPRKDVNATYVAEGRSAIRKAAGFSE